MTTEDGMGIRTIRGVHSVRDQISGLSVLRKVDTTTVYPLADYPATARVVASGEVFLAAIDLDDSDPAEIALLNRLGYRACSPSASPTKATAICWKSTQPSDMSN